MTELNRRRFLAVTGATAAGAALTSSSTATAAPAVQHSDVHGRKPVVVLVHGAFAESASWDGVVRRLQARKVDVVAVANPLRSVTGDATYLRDVIAGIARPVVLVGHSYAGMVITEAAAHNAAVEGLVYVAAFAPEHGESALQLSAKFPGSTLGDALVSYPVSSGGNELVIRPGAFHHQFAADVARPEAALMAATQRPVTEAALTDGLSASTPAWRAIPSWFVFGDEDLNIPVELQRFMADRAHARNTWEIAGASHAISVSRPGAVARSILHATRVRAR
jgi:pimeloyl-ACP methyl ester carboxylesterase